MNDVLLYVERITQICNTLLALGLCINDVDTLVWLFRLESSLKSLKKVFLSIKSWNLVNKWSELFRKKVYISTILVWKIKYQQCCKSVVHNSCTDPNQSVIRVCEQHNLCDSYELVWTHTFYQKNTKTLLRALSLCDHHWYHVLPMKLVTKLDFWCDVSSMKYLVFGQIWGKY